MPAPERAPRRHGSARRLGAGRGTRRSAVRRAPRRRRAHLAHRAVDARPLPGGHHLRGHRVHDVVRHRRDEARALCGARTRRARPARRDRASADGTQSFWFRGRVTRAGGGTECAAVSLEPIQCDSIATARGIVSARAFVVALRRIAVVTPLPLRRKEVIAVSSPACCAVLRAGFGTSDEPSRLTSTRCAASPGVVRHVLRGKRRSARRVPVPPAPLARERLVTIV
jgi:hypothetical protein